MAVITISRQLESGGDDVARLVSEKLNYQIFDKRAMARAGQELGMAAGVVESATNFQPAAKGLLERWFGNYQDPMHSEASSWTFGARNDALQDLTVAQLMQIINAGYQKGNVIVVGRGGMAALQNKPDVLHVRILAPTAMRVKRLAEHENLSLELAQQKIRERDLSDVDWIKRYFGLDSHDPSLFDVIINTAKITPEAAADLVVAALGKLPKA
jgi:cytidylate kinase